MCYFFWICFMPPCICLWLETCTDLNYSGLLEVSKKISSFAANKQSFNQVYSNDEAAPALEKEPFCPRLRTLGSKDTALWKILPSRKGWENCLLLLPDTDWWRAHVWSKRTTNWSPRRWSFHVSIMSNRGLRGMQNTVTVRDYCDFHPPPPPKNTSSFTVRKQLLLEGVILVFPGGRLAGVPHFLNIIGPAKHHDGYNPGMHFGEPLSNRFSSQRKMDACCCNLIGLQSCFYFSFHQVVSGSTNAVFTSVSEL